MKGRLSLNKISILIMKAFLTGLHSSKAGEKTLAPNIKVVMMRGEVEDSELHEGCVIDTFVPKSILEAMSEKLLALEGAKKGGNLRVALYNVSICFDFKESFGDETEVVNTSKAAMGEASWTVDEVRLNLMDSLLKRWQENGVAVVACQKLIDPYLKYALKQKVHLFQN